MSAIRYERWNDLRAKITGLREALAVSEDETI